MTVLMIEQIMEKVPFTKLNGHREKRLPGHANFSFQFIEGESPFIRCDENKLKVYCQVLAPVGTWSSGYDICNYLESQDEGGEEIPVRVEFVFGVNFEK